MEFGLCQEFMSSNHRGQHEKKKKLYLYAPIACNRKDIIGH